MKIQAVLLETSLPAVIERLLLIGVEEVVVSSARIDLSAGHPVVFRGSRFTPDLVERSVLECWPDDDTAEHAVRAIRRSVERDGSEVSIVVTPLDDGGSLQF